MSVTRVGRTFGPLTILTVAGCASLIEPPGLADDPLLRTSGQVYELEDDGFGLGTEIPYTFTNRTGATIYIVNCNGAFGLRLDRWDGEEWVHGWSPAIPQCLSQPIVIEPNGVYASTIHVWAGYPNGDVHPKWDMRDPGGHYRIVWIDALASYQSDTYPFGSQIPEVFRVSNTFLLAKR
jgi:hypothetical protein